MTPNSKHRHFIFDYVISSAALVLATSATIQVSKLEQQVNANKKVQDQLIKIERLHEDHLKHIDNRLKIQEHLIANLIYFNPASDIQSCQILQYTFFCRGRRVIQTNLKNSCLGALYLVSGEM